MADYELKTEEMQTSIVQLKKCNIFNKTRMRNSFSGQKEPNLSITNVQSLTTSI